MSIVHPPHQLPISDLSLSVSPRLAGEILDYSKTKIFALMKAGELQSYLDGGARRILTQSIRDYVSRRVAETAADPLRHARPKRQQHSST